MTANTPVDYFMQLFDEEAIDLVHNETCRFYQQYLENKAQYLQDHPQARAHDLAKNPISKPDIKTFIALVIGMGICGYPTIRYTDLTCTIHDQYLRMCIYHYGLGTTGALRGLTQTTTSDA